MIEVCLTKWESIIGAQIGCLRHIESVYRNGKNGKGIKEEDGFKHHVNGSLGEVAVAKALNLHWPASVNTFKQPDIPPNLQVRWRPDHDKELTVRTGDADDDIFILVTGCVPNMRVHGWLTGQEAKQDQWVANPFGRGECYFVPQSALHPIEELPKQ